MKRSLATVSICCCCLQLLSTWTTTTFALSLDSTSLTGPRRQQQRRRPIQRVAVIGSGIAGLSVAHALSNSPGLKKSAQEAIAAAAAASSGGDNNAMAFPDFEVSLFDSRPSFDTKTGAGVQLNGGLSVLHKINPSVCQAVMQAGLRQTKLTSKCRRWQNDNEKKDGNTNNNDYPMDTLLELDIRQIVENSGTSVTQSLLLPDNGKTTTTTTSTLLWIAIMRNSIQQALLDTLPPDIKNHRLYYNKYLTNIQTSTNNNNGDGDRGGAYCEFADGTTAGPFDLIVGCDGIQSACKEFLERGKISSKVDESSSKRRQGGAAAGAIYSGVRIKYAVRDGDKPNDDDNDNEQAQQQQQQPAAAVASLSQGFGDGAYVFQGEFGAGVNAPPTKCTYLVYQDPDYFGPFPIVGRRGEKGKDDVNNKDNTVLPQADVTTTTTSNNVNNPADENADWTQNIPKSDLQAARDKMTQQAHNAKIDIGPIVATADRIFELGVYFHNPFSCTGWSKEYYNNDNSNDNNGDDDGGGGTSSSTLVLCGDAAHAMPPFLGQGANQAIQDAYCLATKLYDYNVAVTMEHISSNKNVLQYQQESATTTPPPPTTLRSLLQEYERIRWAATFQIFWKSVFLGYLETGGNDGLYAKFRDVFFKTMGILGVARMILLSAAVPKV